MNLKQNSLNEIVFPGSFDPIHNGHLFIIKNILNKYNYLIILISNNEKKNNSNIYFRKIKIILFLWRNKVSSKNIKIVINKTKTTDKLKLLNINTIVRGYRDDNDLEYEEILFNCYLKELPNLKRELIKSDETNINFRSSNLK